MSEQNGFTKEQQSYFQGFMLGTDVARTVRGLPVLSGSCETLGANVQVGGDVPVAVSDLMNGSSSSRPAGSEGIHFEAQQKLLDAGKKLAVEEKAKRDKQAFDMWDELLEHAREGRYPKGTDVFLFKFHGLFYVAPAQDSYMCRLRIPGGELKSFQMRGLAELADCYAGGHADMTTRANLQYRGIKADDGVKVLMGLMDIGLIIRGSGADNLRNITSSPTSGIDPDELIETLPLAKQMNHYILQHREMYGLPRKFNIAFDGGGKIASLDDTNDIGFFAVRVGAEAATESVPEGVYFRLTLGGITGHKDFARDTGVLVKEQECVPTAAAIVKVFSMLGDRTDRKKARLKYVLDRMGFDAFMAEVQKELPLTLRKFDISKCDLRPSVDRFGHVGIHRQSQEGKSYMGVVAPVGRLTSEQMRKIADIADRLGSGRIRLTVWQNLIIPDIADHNLDEAKRRIEEMGLEWSPNSIRANLIACTGNAGCKFAAADTKRNALELAAYIEERIELDLPINIHFTGCHHSCAQHYIGDIGMIGTKVEVGEDMVEGYHVFVGGGYGVNAAIGEELFTSVTETDLPGKILALLEIYLERRLEGETFLEFTWRIGIAELKQLCLDNNLIPA